MKAGRITHLDSLRGLAALIVVFHHCLVTFPAFWAVYQSPVSDPLMRLWGNSPLHLLWDGPEFVLVFFTLSGFVLSLPFWGDRPPAYGGFVIRRVFRIYPTYLVAIVIGMVLMSLLAHGPLTNLSDWTSQFWNRPLDTRIVLEHLFVMGSAGDNYIDTPVWSLVVEMHASLIFPLIILALRRHAIIAMIALFALGLAGDRVVHSSWPGGHPFLASFATTASFLWLFGAGALMARHRAALAAYVARIPRLLQIPVLAGALVAMNSIWQFGADLQWRLLEQSGALLLVACAAFMGFMKTGLDVAPLRWLGKISYSLYLIHFIVLFAVLNAFRGNVGLPLVLAIVPALSIVSAAVLYRFVEVPSIAWGHRLSGRRPASEHGVTSATRDAPPSRVR